MSGAVPPAVTLREALPVWGRIALLSFGGPAGQIALMHRVLVEERRWISEARFLHALNFCMVLPGPEAQQLATYVGWLMHGTRGAVLAGGLFVLPGALCVMALSWAYVLVGDAGAVEGLLFGLKAAVLAVVLGAVARIGQRTLRTPAMLGVAAASFLAIFALDVPFPVIIVAAVLAGLAGARLGRPAEGGEPSEELAPLARPTLAGSLRVAATWLLVWLGPVALILALLGPGHVMADIALLFSGMAVVTFGGAYAVLAHVAEVAVGTYGWLAPGEMLDGLGLAETTPGPLILVLQFVGFLAAFRDPGALPPLLAGTLGGVLATWVTFAPCFLWILLGAPFVERLRGNRAIEGALRAIGAAVVGVILNLALWFAVHTLFAEVRPLAAGPLSLEVPVPASLDPWALLLALGALLAVFAGRLGAVAVLAGSACAGLALRLAGLAG